MGTEQIAKKTESWQGVKQTHQHELSGNVNLGLGEQSSAAQWQNEAWHDSDSQHLTENLQ